ncbi:conjugal transfer protein TraN [uncultured Thiodictyon sp.]|uniref:conjugal transfer protein TraN n=1 Tax=uncultured Thiodictyon sp. TaxID=1846217 RepID=UPI0025FFEA8D|nr:conjugal transfer protein TraN [uncultured Thiodictyon sp.]
MNRSGGWVWGRRLIVAVVSLSVSWTPWALVWGDAFRDAAQAGEAIGTQTRTTATVPNAAGGAVQFPANAGGPIAIQTLFPGSNGGNSAAFGAYFGNHDATVTAGQNAQRDLLQSQSSAGDAYRALRDGVDRPHLDISSQAAWQPTDALANNLGNITKTFADCSLHNQFTQGLRTLHVPDYRICERLPTPPPDFNCTATASGQTLYSCPPYPGLYPAPLQNDPGDQPIACFAVMIGVQDLDPLNGQWSIQPPECLQALTVRNTDPFCRIVATCTTPAGGGGCLGTSINATCGSFYKGAMDCWVDPKGETQCPTNAGTTNSCAAIEADAACTFVRRACVDGATGPDGTCHVFEETWDCGTRASVPIVTRTSRVDCAGPVTLPTATVPATPVRCVGTECASFPSEQSTDFAKAAVALQAAQMSAADMECVPGGRCVVFPGEARECKRAVSGIVNCCTSPGNASLGDYMDLVFAMSKINNAILGLDSSSAVRGAWETLTGPVSDAYSAVSQQFTSAANTFMGQTSSTVSENALKTALSEATQQLMMKAAEWTANIFGEAAANTLFVSAAGGPAVSGGVVSAGVALAPMLACIISVVMWAYLIYQVVMILIKIIWKCEQSEFELGAKRDLKSCVFVGGYCRSRTLGYCVEKRDSYCCFGSPLGRIMNEQVRPQLGRGWGTPKQPDCEGVNVSDFQRIDWSAVNLDEWMALLVQTGHYPNMNAMGIEALTGTGSDLATKAGRPNAEVRSVDRVSGMDSDQARGAAERQLWNGTQALPK